MTIRCTAGSCTDPAGGPEPTATLLGLPAHPDCAEYEESIGDSPEMTAALRRHPRAVLMESGVPGIPPVLLTSERYETPAETAARAAADRDLFEPDRPRSMR